jgi:hypothetical protein
LNPTAQTKTINGVTFTNNGDGTYTVNGTASDVTYFPLADPFTDLDLSRKYKIVGCPQGGSGNTYLLYDDKNALLKDTGNGAVYTPANQPKIYIRITSGYTANNLIFKPMLTTDLSADYDSFVKYSGSEERLNEQVASLHESSNGIITNLLNPTAQTQTIGGVSITNNGDGTYLINGTYTGTGTNWMSLGQFTFEKNTKCKLTGTPPTSTLGENGCLRLERNNFMVGLDTGNGVVFNAYSESTYKLLFQIRRGAVFNNLLFKPMLTTDLNATYDDYVPYSGDGRLNENVAGLFDEIDDIYASEATEAEITSLE